ncbi:MAG: hypothetical protein WA142_06755 [Rugosibacter sp.]
MKQLMPLHSQKGQERALPFSLWMRYQAVEQKMLSFKNWNFALRADLLAVANSETASLDSMSMLFNWHAIE